MDAIFLGFRTQGFETYYSNSFFYAQFRTLDCDYPKIMCRLERDCFLLFSALISILTYLVIGKMLNVGRFCFS